MIGRTTLDIRCFCNDIAVFDMLKKQKYLTGSEENLIYNSYSMYYDLSVVILSQLNINTSKTQYICGYNITLYKCQGLPIEINDNNIIIRYDNEKFDKYLYLYLICVAFKYKYLYESYSDFEMYPVKTHILEHRLTYDELIKNISKETLTFEDYVYFYEKLYNSYLFEKYRMLNGSVVNEIYGLTYLRDIIYVIYLELFKKYKNNAIYSLNKKFLKL